MIVNITIPSYFPLGHISNNATKILIMLGCTLRWFYDLVPKEQSFHQEA
jgi:hypothetical protein